MNNYQMFLKNKQRRPVASGFRVESKDINPKLFLFQRDIVIWALKLGKAAIFAECGLGKTGMQLEWAKHVVNHTGGKVLILAPLAVAHQTVKEGNKFDVKVLYVQEDADIAFKGDGYSIFITNYERLDKFDTDQFSGIVLDESSILKSFTGKTKQGIISAFENTPYKLACTATPAPNDHMELGNHADFLSVMPANEMLTRWFVHDSGNTQEWRLKQHAVKDFWRWLTSWAVCISEPCDLGSQYDMEGYKLPDLNIKEHFIAANEDAYKRAHSQGMLFPETNPSSIKLHKVKRESLQDRVAQAKVIVDSIPDGNPIILWCDTNYEESALKATFPDATVVTGSDSLSAKETKLQQFTDNEIKILITKPSIAGFGLNWQHCHEMIFVGASYSFEKTYQALRRSWRFGQTHAVNAHIIYAETEGNVIKVLNEKQEAFKIMQKEMNEAMNEHGLFRDDKKLSLTIPTTEKTESNNWTMYLGDCVEVSKQLADDSIDFCIHSPPFANLYIYSDSEADMGNAADDDEFFNHYEYLIEELYRITTPGRLCAVHCIDTPTFKWKDGFAGIKDFSGQIISSFSKLGWSYHSRVTIWKDPVTEMQRTKAHGLLHKTFKKDSTACRVGSPDYLLMFRKPLTEKGAEKPVSQNRKLGDYVGTNPPPENGNGNYSIEVWQRYASPVWFDINQSNTLNYRIAKGEKDEKHICPLQLDVIARSIDLWSNEGDVVFSPFAGIGSEGYEAIKMKRKFVGIELKPEYYNYAIKHLQEADRIANQVDLFSLNGIEVDVSL